MKTSRGSVGGDYTCVVAVVWYGGQGCREYYNIQEAESQFKVTYYVPSAVRAEVPLT